MKVKKEMLFEILVGSQEPGGLQTSRLTPRSQQTGPRPLVTGSVTTPRPPAHSFSSSSANGKKPQIVEENVYQFEYLYTETGFGNVKRWFNTAATPPKTLNEPKTFNENEFIKFLRELTDFPDHQILEVFDIFDKDDKGTIGFNEIFLLISLLAARETGHTLQFLYQHGKDFFDLLVDDLNTNILTFEQFLHLGYVMGLNEETICASLKDFQIDENELIDYDNFILYYYAVFDELDRNKRASASNFSSSSSAITSKDKCVIS